MKIIDKGTSTGYAPSYILRTLEIGRDEIKRLFKERDELDKKMDKLEGINPERRE